jgi:alcohol dehydrogenase class IV
MNFQFFSPTKIIAGRGCINTVPALIQEFGQKPFLLYGTAQEEHGTLSRLTTLLAQKNIASILYKKPLGEPDVKMVDAAAQEAKTAQCDAVISLGGGAVIDLGKAVAGLATNPGSVQDYMEGIGTGKQVTQKPLPHIAVPTTAGTGAEVTKNAVITAPSVQYKKSFRSPLLFPTAAILDAELTLSLPLRQTVYSGMDAITQLIESWISKAATPITDALAQYGLQLAFPAIETIFDHGGDIAVREKLLLASTLSGICLANAGLGMAHGFAPALGALYDIPHGKACAILLPHALQYNRDYATAKIAQLGRILTGDSSGTDDKMAEFAIVEIQKQVSALGIPGDFSSYAIPASDIPRIVERAQGNSMNGNPVTVSPEQAAAFIKNLL